MRILVTILISFLHLSVSFGSLWTAQNDRQASFNKSFTTEESGQEASKDPRAGDQESADTGENEDEACHRHALRPMLASITPMQEGLQRLPETFYRASISRDIHKPPPESGIC